MQQNYNNYLLLEILKLSTKFHIIPQTHKKKTSVEMEVGRTGE